MPGPGIEPLTGGMPSGRNITLLRGVFSMFPPMLLLYDVFGFKLRRFRFTSPLCYTSTARTVDSKCVAKDGQLVAHYDKRKCLPGGSQICQNACVCMVPIVYVSTRPTTCYDAVVSKHGFRMPA